ncbi:MAG: hypothetical protein K0U41_04710 [Gammaproteobacteria bacterium]|nr:hypothetical protein [Gammaproteobacteria bacterium]
MLIHVGLAIVSWLFFVTSIFADTGTPFPKGTRVTVEMSSGDIQGVLQETETEGWILLKEEGKPNLTAIKLWDSTTVTPLQGDREATFQYWVKVSKVLNDLNNTEDDRGFWSNKPLFGDDRKRFEFDFPPMAANTLRKFSDEIRQIDAANVHIAAIEMGSAISDYITASSTLRGSLLTAAADGANSNYGAIIERSNRQGNDLRTAKQLSYTKINAAFEKLSVTYGAVYVEALPSLQMPKINKP